MKKPSKRSSSEAASQDKEGDAIMQERRRKSVNIDNDAVDSEPVVEDLSIAAEKSHRAMMFPWP